VTLKVPNVSSLNQKIQIGVAPHVESGLLLGHDVAVVGDPLEQLAAGEELQDQHHLVILRRREPFSNAHERITIRGVGAGGFGRSMQLPNVRYL
jgi:hypothetical protein